MPAGVSAPSGAIMTALLSTTMSFARWFQSKLKTFSK